MPIKTELIRIQSSMTPLLTADAGVLFSGTAAPGAVSAAQVRGYMASIESYLAPRSDGVAGGLRTRLQTVEGDSGLSYWLSQRDTHATAYLPSALGALPPGVLGPLRTLDHIALDLKDAANHSYRCQAVTANVDKTLDKVSTGDRQKLASVIDLFTITSCANGEAPIQTVAHLPRPETTYRIDREQLSQAPAPRYWTYRLQKESDTNAGILMETGVHFLSADIRAAFTTSLTSIPLLAPNQVKYAPGVYRQLSAPNWLRLIVQA